MHRHMQASQITKQQSDLFYQTRSQYYQPTKRYNKDSSYIQSKANQSDYFTIKNRRKTQTFFLDQKQKFKKRAYKTFDKGFKFSNQRRFSKSQACYNDICQFDIPDAKAKTYTTFGYGKKYPISKVIIKRANQSPSPNQYNSCIIGKTDHGRYKSYCNSIRETQAKRQVFHRKDVYSQHFLVNNPGFIYDIREKLAVKKLTMGKKLTMYTEKMSDLYSHVPGPCYNVDQRKLKNIGGIEKGASFNLGKKMDLAKPLNDNPGPQYEINGFCNKFIKIKKKLNSAFQKKVVGKKFK